MKIITSILLPMIILVMSIPIANSQNETYEQYLRRMFPIKDSEAYNYRGKAKISLSDKERGLP